MLTEVLRNFVTNFNVALIEQKISMRCEFPIFFNAIRCIFIPVCMQMNVAATTIEMVQI